MATEFISYCEICSKESTSMQVCCVCDKRVCCKPSCSTFVEDFNFECGVGLTFCKNCYTPKIKDELLEVLNICEENRIKMVNDWCRLLKLRVEKN